MSDPSIRGPLSASANVAAEVLAKHQALPPDKKNENRAYFGAFLLGVSAYVTVVLGPYASSYPAEWKLGLVGVAGLGLLLLLVGWRGARGPRDFIGAAFAIAIPLGGFIAVINWAPGLLESFYVRAFCCGVLVANLVRLWLAIRGPGQGNAQEAVRRQIAENVVEWRAVKRRR